MRAVLNVLRREELIVDPKKAYMFMGEVEFCGHILREGRRSPAPGKLLSIQKCELPGTVTALRVFCVLPTIIPATSKTLQYWLPR